MPNAAVSEYQTTEEVAIDLRLNPQTVARYAARDQITGAIKVGNRYRFKRGEWRLLSKGEMKKRSGPPSGPSIRERMAQVRAQYRR